MLETFIGAFALVFILCGMFFVGYVAFQKLLCRGKGRKTVTVMAGYPQDEKLPEEVYAAFVSSNLLNIMSRNEVIVLDLGIEKSTKEACRSIVGGNGNVQFLKVGDFENIMGYLC